jgi:2-keto-4-pentenoate hydratase
VQRAYVRLLRQARGTQSAGYKVGLTSKRMQAMCGLDSPVAGVVLADGVVHSGATLTASAYGRLGLEFEIAVRMRRDLRPPAGGSLDIADVADAVEAICPAIEIIDDRHADYGALDARSLIADNAWNAGIVLGTFAAGVGGDLAAIEGVVSIDGNAVDRGRGGDVLGHPFHSVAWLATALSQSGGGGLRAGDVVMTGSIVPTRFPERPSHYRFVASGLGAVEVTVRM